METFRASRSSISDRPPTAEWVRARRNGKGSTLGVAHSRQKESVTLPNDCFHNDP